MFVCENYETIEYVMLDEENCTVICVYTKSELVVLEEYSSYEIMPKKLNITETNFSVYIDTVSAPEISKVERAYNEAFLDAEYNIDFLQYLFTNNLSAQ